MNRKIFRFCEASESCMRRHLPPYLCWRKNRFNSKSDESHTHLTRTHLTSPYVRKTSSKVFQPQRALSSNLSYDESVTSPSIPPDNRNNDGAQSSLLQKWLTPWERWMAKKEAERNKVAHKLAERKAQNETKRLLEEEKCLEKKRVERAKVQEWMEKKNTDFMKQKKLAAIYKLEQKAEATKKKAQQIKSKEKYQEWLNKKRREEEVQNRRREEESYLRGLTQQEKRRQAEAAFQAWLHSHKVSSTAVDRRSPYTYCISDGMLVKYFDRTSAPEPEFFNKKDWIS
ncbi:Coiled-coil domain-containing protein 34 [Taenia crassiceps]|uniref:Coiled-coil domain-containing protein 34 n=1 Tax=Taenia crassiceps TaxID=6207 RepID=A0ABR4QJ81_9CEST